MPTRYIFTGKNQTFSNVFLVFAWDCGVHSASLDSTTELSQSFSASVLGVFSATSACHPEGPGLLLSDESAAPSASLFSLVGPDSFASDGTATGTVEETLFPGTMSDFVRFLRMAEKMMCHGYSEPPST